MVMKSKDEILKKFDAAHVEHEKLLDLRQDFISTLDFNINDGDSWSNEPTKDSEVILNNYKFTQSGDEIRAEEIKEDYTPLEFAAPLINVTKEEFEDMYPEVNDGDNK